MISVFLWTEYWFPLIVILKNCVDQRFSCVSMALLTRFDRSGEGLFLACCNARVCDLLWPHCSGVTPALAETETAEEQCGVHLGLLNLRKVSNSTRKSCEFDAGCFWKISDLLQGVGKLPDFMKAAMCSMLGMSNVAAKRILRYKQCSFLLNDRNLNHTSEIPPHQSVKTFL